MNDQRDNDGDFNLTCTVEEDLSADWLKYEARPTR